MSTKRGQPHSWTGDQGYTYTATLTTVSLEASIEVADAPPGKAYIVGKFTRTGTLENTTSGHKAPWPAFSVSLAWTAPSDVCSLATKGTTNAFPTNETASANYCTGSGMVPTVGSANDLASLREDLDVGEVRPFSKVSPFEIEVLEQDADRVLASFKTPDLYVIGRHHNGQEVPRTTNCVVEGYIDGGYMAASTKPVEECVQFP